MRRTRAGRALTGMLAAGFAAACAEPGVAPREHARIASFVPAATGIVVALGEAERVVATASDDPTPGVGHARQAGTVLSPDAERVAGSGADLVFVAPEAARRSLGSLERGVGTHVEVLAVTRLSDVALTVRRVGGLIGQVEAAERLATSIERDLGGASHEARTRPQRSVLWVVSATPIVAAGPGTYLDDLGARVNLRNVLADSPVPWPALSAEALVARAPDVVLWVVEGVAPPTADDARPPWSALDAVSDGRILRLDPSLFLQPGPRIGVAARRLVELVHHAPSAGPGS